MLLSLEDQIGASAGVVSPAEMLAVAEWVRRGRPGRPSSETAAGPAVSPIVNHGRWLVCCPFCPSANRASRQDRRFLCCDCWNSAAGGKWLPVVWPADAQAIDDALCARPARATRHWAPGELVADLVAENGRHV